MTASPSRWSGPAPAKVNLRLDVLEREPSGYHRIETVFQRLELADRVEVEVEPGRAADGEVRLEVTGLGASELGPAADNLAVRAAHRFLAELRDAEERSGTSDLADASVRIHLQKRIPHGSGLGGGSSDAAAVLRGLNELAGERFSLERLMEIGGELGADVPFFVSGTARALGTGRGDRIVALPPLPARHVLLAVPEEGISTAWAYGVLADARATGEVPAPDSRPRSPTAEAPAAVTSWSAAEGEARNDFEPVLFPLRPDLERLKAALVQMGARPALLSGSGAVVFGVFPDLDALRRADAAVRDRAGVAASVSTRTVGEG